MNNFFNHLVITVATMLIMAACGPTCPEVKSALDDSQVMAEDVERVNALVDKRKITIAEADSGEQSTFALERLKFSVTAYEIAIELELRIIKLSPQFEDSSRYGEMLPLFEEIRCNFDKIIKSNGHTLSDSEGKKIQDYYSRVKAVLINEGKISQFELKRYFEEGIEDESSSF